MSINLQVDGLVLWNPSNRPGYMFHGQISSASVVFKFSSGLSEIIEDEVFVDLPVFQDFVAAVFAEYSRSLHGLFQRMIIGFLGPALVLVERAGGTLPEFGIYTDYWTQLMADHSRLMPR